MRSRRRRPRASAIGSLVLLVTTFACDSPGSDQAQPTAGSVTAPVEATTPPAAPADLEAEDFDVSLFDGTSHVVDNEWFPLVPGARYVWEGRAFDDEGQRIERKVVFVVTDLTKVIGGVRAAVGWDRDFNDGDMGESELVFYAQDRYGNVWHLGEYVEHWEDGELDGGRLWVVGDPVGAEAGIQMTAQPAEGDEYSQGYAPRPWFWDDRARVSDVGVRTCVPVDCYSDALVVEEYEPRFPAAFQLKYYASGVGGIRIGWRGPNEEEQEEMELTSFTQLDADALARVRTAVLEQEHRGYAYGRTEPAQPLEP